MKNEIRDTTHSGTGAAHGIAGERYPHPSIALIRLPVNSLRTRAAKRVVSRVATVTGEHAAVVLLRHNYWAGATIVEVELSIHFEPGAVSESVDVCMALDLDAFTVGFAPGIDRFLREPVFCARARGLDLSALPNGVALHLYCIDAAVCEIIPSEPIEYDKAAGSLTLTNAVIPHFSLYGFGFIR